MCRKEPKLADIMITVFLAFSSKKPIGKSFSELGEPTCFTTTSQVFRICVAFSVSRAVFLSLSLLGQIYPLRSGLVKT